VSGGTPLSREQLLAARCAPLGADAALDDRRIAAQIAELPSWSHRGSALEAGFAFDDWQATIAFVNAIAAIADAEDHHPDLEVSYGRCTVRWGTHSAGGVTLNDFVCAARTDAAYDRR
jgi:4a-hydroxytetrahydrobiopterin dehydratase